MKSIVLVFPSGNPDLLYLAGVVQPAGDVSLADKSLTVERPDGLAFVVKVLDAASNGIFEDWPDALVPKQNSSIFAIKYRGDGLMLEVISLLAGVADLIVDNDHGGIAGGSEVSLDFLNPN